MTRILGLNIALRGTWWLFPLAIVLACTGVGLVLERTGVVARWYASPYVVVVAWAALRSGRRGGLLAAALSSLIWNIAFVPPFGVFVWPTTDEIVVYISMFAVAGIIGSYHRPDVQQVATGRYRGTLPFVKSEPRDGHKFWDVTRSGDWALDCVVGSEYARIYVERRSEMHAPLLGWIVRDMIKVGVYSGVEAGFIGGLAAYIPARQRIGMPLVAHDNADDGKPDRAV